MIIKKLKKTNYYLLLSCLLIIFETLLILKSKWSDDFFEHSAVINELSRDLINPSNPIIKSDIPHAFFSPYSLSVAIFSKITSLNSIQSLEVFAILNLIFFLFAFYFFIKNIVNDNYQKVVTISLIFTLLFWGFNPFGWSGFYHIFTLNYVLPYPSTFTMGLTLLTLGIVAKNHKKHKVLNILAVIVFSSVVLITHPTTAITLFVGIVSLNFVLNGYSIQQCILKSVLLIIPSILLGIIWPYFSLVDLFISNNVDFHMDSSKLYLGMFEKNWPILLIIPSFFYSKKDPIIYFFLLTIISLLLIYFGGLLFNFYGVSRTISGAMLFSHYLLAYYCLLLIKNQEWFSKAYIITLFLGFFTSIGLNFFQLGSLAYGIFKQKDTSYYEKYAFLKNFVGHYNIVLSDDQSNWIIPSYSGKVISSEQPLYWVDDIKLRRNAVTSFFEKENPDSIRQSIIKTYNPDFILINHSIVKFDPLTFQWLRSIGETIYNKDQMELIKIN